MSNKDLNRSIKIFIDGSEAAQGVSKVENAIQKLEAKLAGLNKSEADYATRSRQLQQELNKKNKTLQDYKAKVEETDRVLKNLSGATYNQLISVQAQVRKDLRKAIPGTQQYTAALEQNRRVTEALTRAQAAMRVEVGCQGTTLGRAVGFFNKYAAVVTTGIAAITGATMALNTLREKRNQREEAKADVQALTGLDSDSIAWLEQQAIQLSTTIDESGIRIRQSATEILDAYKLVGSAKPELLENKEALAEVTKQTLILASASGMKLKDAVDAVTLSLNQYGDGADQAARYANVMAAGSKYGAAAVESVTSAITKSGVAAASADIPIEQLVGTIETLAEKGIKDEIAGTGLKKFFLTLQTGADDTNPKIVGLETALDNLQKKQLSAAKIKKMFGEEGYNVASVLINEAEKVNYYTEAVTGTSVAMEQAATKSDTAAAKLDQAKNRMHEIGIELMDKLNPALVSAANGAVNWTSRLVALVSWINKHKAIVLTTTIAIASYYTGVKLATLWETRFKDAKLATVAADKLRLYWTKLVAASQYTAMGVQSLFTSGMGTLSSRVLFSKDCFAMLFRILKLNPFGIIATLVAGVAIGIYKLATRTTEASRAVQSFIQKNIEEQRELRKTYNALLNTKDGSRARQDLIDEFNRKYGGYLSNLLSEKSTINDVKVAYQEASIAIQQKMAAQSLSEKTEEIERKSLDKKAETLQNLQDTLSKGLTDNQLQKALPKIIDYVDKYIQQGYSVEDITKGVARGISNTYQQFRLKQDNGKWGLDLIPKIAGQVKDYVEVVKESANEVQAVKDKLNPFLKKETPKPANQLEEVVITPEKQKPSGGGTSLTDEEIKKRIKAELDTEKKLYEQKQATLKEFYLEGHDETLQTEKQFNSEMECLQIEHLQRSIRIVGEKSQEAAQYQNQINDIKIKQQREHIQQQIDAEKELYEQQQTDLKLLYASGNDENLRTEQAYNEAMEQLTLMHLERTLQIAGLTADQQKAIEKQLLDFKVKCLNDELKERQRLEKKDSDPREAQAKKEQQRYQQRASQYANYGQQLGDSLGAIISKQENAMEGFADTMIDIVFDVLTQIINVELIKLTGVGISAAAEVTAREIGSKGFWGIASGAALAGLIAAGIATARSGLKGLIGKRKDTGESSDSDSPEPPKTATVTVNQWASGHYNVIGQDDNRTYRDVPYIGPAPTGIVHRTSLISETGSELIINAEDLARLQRHINYPLVVQAINDARTGRVPQRADGNYDPLENCTRNVNSIADGSVSASELRELCAQIGQLISKLGNLRAYIVLRDLREAEDLDHRARETFTKKNK